MRAKKPKKSKRLPSGNNTWTAKTKEGNRTEFITSKERKMKTAITYYRTKKGKRMAMIVETRVRPLEQALNTIASARGYRNRTKELNKFNRSFKPGTGWKESKW
jgi:hypothetical protein